jgi:hypothetical protein
MPAAFFVTPYEIGAHDGSEIIERIHTCLPGLEIEQVELNEDGLANRVAVINRRWVVRWARTEAARAALQREGQALALLRPRARLPLPEFVYQGGDMVAYALLPGEALRRNAVLRLPAAGQDALAQQLGAFWPGYTPRRRPKRAPAACRGGPYAAYTEMVALYEQHSAN